MDIVILIIYRAPMANVVEAIVKGKLLRWGNSVGVRIAKRDARRLKLREGSDVTVRIEATAGRIDLSVLPIVHGSGTEGAKHDEILGKARQKGLRP